MSVEWPELVFPPINLLSFNRENSPCRKLCKLDNGVCVGCLRTIDEIQNWAVTDRYEKLSIISRIYKEDPSIFM